MTSQRLGMDMSQNLYWRLPTAQRVGDGGASTHREALQRAFGSLPYRTVPHDVHLLRAMAATEPPGGIYEKLANLVDEHRVVEIYVE